jgi:glycosyltransferase involved in cell wall biosynthesis
MTNATEAQTEGSRATFLSIVIPAYNEAAALAGVLREVEAAADALPCPSEIVVVDDCSADETAALATADPRVRLVRNPVNLGYGHSLMRGIAAARGDAIALCDADGSYDPAGLVQLFARLQDGVDHAVGQRTGRFFQRPFLRRHAYRWLCGYVTGTHVPDANSGLRVFRREIFEHLKPDLCRGFSFTTSLTLASYLSGCVVAYCQVPYRARIGRSHVRFRDVLRTAQYLVQLIVAYNPLKFFFPLVTVSGGLTLVAAVLALAGREGWLLPAWVMGAATLLLAGLGGHAYIVSRAAGGSIGVTAVR